MAKITAADVAKLRKMTGAGMMDCKNSLIKAEGNFEKAIEIIRKKGMAVANKRADRDATEGCVLAGISSDNKSGAIVVLNCETDFVAKNEDFVKLTRSFLNLAIENKPANLNELKELELEGRKLSDYVIEQTGIIGEKLDISYYEYINAEEVTAYIHPGNKVATIIGLNKSGLDVQVGKDIAMQVAAMRPVAVDKDSIPEDIVKKELEIGRDQARQEGKPENMLDKIAQGKLNKFFKESTLLNQAFIKDSKMNVKAYIESVDKEATVTGFKRFSLAD